MGRQANITRPAHPADEVAPLGKGNTHSKPIDALRATELGLPPRVHAMLEVRGKARPRSRSVVANFVVWLISMTGSTRSPPGRSTRRS